MVTVSERQAGRLGAVLLYSSLAGILSATGAVVALLALGEPLGSWVLTPRGWWSGGYPWLRGLAGGGLWLLVATPVAMLLVYGTHAAFGRRWRGLVTAIGLVLVLVAAALAVCLRSV